MCGLQVPLVQNTKPIWFFVQQDGDWVRPLLDEAVPCGVSGNGNGPGDWGGPKTRNLWKVYLYQVDYAWTESLRNAVCRPVEGMLMTILAGPMHFLPILIQCIFRDGAKCWKQLEKEVSAFSGQLRSTKCTMGNLTTLSAGIWTRCPRVGHKKRRGQGDRRQGDKYPVQ